MDRERIYIVGCGPGSREHITLKALSVIERATVCVGAERLLKEFLSQAPSKGVITLKGNYRAVLDEIGRLWNGGERVAVLVSGDPLLYSFGALVVERFGKENCHVVPGVSSVQYAFSMLKEGWQGYSVVSLHGRTDHQLKEMFRSGRALVILLDGGQGLSKLAKQLEGVELEGYRFYLASELATPQERLYEVYPEQFYTLKIPSLSILIAGRL